MKILIISDTHCMHRKLKLPEADMIIHCGDFSHRGRPLEVFDFLDWYGKLSYKYKVLVCGNHEVQLDKETDYYKFFTKECKKVGIEHLFHEHRTIRGYKFFGSPYTPEFFDWGFMYPRTQGKEYWSNIEQDTEIVVTHGPPYSIMDKGHNGLSAGCNDLFDKVQTLPNLKLHCFGHFHSHHGQEGIFVNASCCNEQYKLKHKPYVLIELPDKE